MPKGSKTCSCGVANGPRAFNCKSCGKAFSFKNPDTKPKKKKKIIRVGKKFFEATTSNVNWKEIPTGSMIMVKGGPYWATNALNHTYVGYHGRCRVISKDHKGMVVYSFKEGGFGYVYMGEPSYNEETGIYLEAHKVAILSNKED